MRRWLVLLFVVSLPLQFAWSAASAYCQHETSEQQTRHVGHHLHVHEGEAKKSTAASNLMADSDCVSCHASGTPAIPTMPSVRDFSAAAASAVPGTSLRFSSALARAPDRPQWLRLV